MHALLTMTNATKANVIALINAVLGLLVAFGVSITEAQIGAIITLVNVACALWISTTYKQSSKRRATASHPRRAKHPAAT